MAKLAKDRWRRPLFLSRAARAVPVFRDGECPKYKAYSRLPAAYLNSRRLNGYGRLDE